MKPPEVWLRGPVEGVPALLQPVAHALLQVREDLAPFARLSAPALHARPGGAASIAFHLHHLAGALDRLFTYARGDALDEEQRRDLTVERAGGDPEQGAEALVRRVQAKIDAALGQLKRTPPASLTDERRVGSAGHPSTVLGLLFHGAEHAQRHAGQIATTTRLVNPDPED
jgi:uncharacterized damage-inducible protein DinB